MTDGETKTLQKLDEHYRSVSLSPRDAVPSVIHHYTSAAGLLGITKSGILRASNFNYLNDSTEIHHGRSMAVKMITERLEGDLPRSHRHVLGNAQRTLEDVGRGRDFYLACFCTKGDLLSQWRGYGSPKDRFSIGFNAEQLPTRGLAYRFKSVVYRRSEQRPKLKKAVDAALAAVGTAQQSQELLEQVGQLLTEKLIAELVFFKDWSFRDEREWRAVHSFEPEKDEVKFDVSGGFMRPFVNLWVGRMDKNGQRRLPITEITVFAKRAVRSVELLLKEHGYRGVSVRSSTVPYQEL